MTGHLLLVAIVAALFYAAIPAIGAVTVRARWRTFRALMVAASRYPTAAPASVGRERGSFLGRCRFFGTLEAIQGDDRIWISNGRFSVAVDLRGVRVYLIPDQEDTGLASVPWNRIFSLPEGTPMFVAGRLVSEEGRATFREHPAAPLIVVIHDCPRESILVRVIGSGRQRNEYMNMFTLPSVGIGSLTLVLLAFTFLGVPEHLTGLIAFTAALAPIAPFLPPGFPLYFAYRSAWKRGRLLRAQRDIVRLPLRWFPAPAAAAPPGRRATLLPDMEPYAMLRGSLDPADPSVFLCDGARISLPPEAVRLAVDLPALGRNSERGPGPDSVLFSAYAMDGESVRLVPTEDPMAGLVLVPGIPEAIAKASEKGAQRLTALSALFLSLNIVVNVPLLFFVLVLVIR